MANTGYAYTDKYGFSHVVSSAETAKQYAKAGTGVSTYTGNYGGGYATNDQGGRVALSLPGSVDYGNTNLNKQAGVSVDTPLGQSGNYTQYIGPTLFTTAQKANPIPGYNPTNVGAKTTNPIPGFNQTQAVTNNAGAAQPTNTNGQYGATGTQPAMDWQQRLQWISSNPSSPEVQQWTNSEIARAGQVWQQKTAAGDTAGAEAAHQWANQVRNAMGMQAGVNYDQKTGATISPVAGISTGQPIQTSQPAQVEPWWNNFAQTKAPYENVPYATDTQNTLKELQKQIETPFSYDPQTDPQYKALVDSATQSVMESMNARGILDSTVTRDQVAQSIAPIISQLMQQAYTRYQGNIGNISNLLSSVSGLENQQYERQRYAEETAYERQRQEYLDQLAAENRAIEARREELKMAIDRVNALGYVDNQASVILGIPVGTPSWEAQKFAQQEVGKLETKQMEIDAAMQRAQLSADTSRANNSASIAGANQRAAAGRQQTQTTASATNRAIAELYSYNSREEAEADLKLYGSKMADSGVNMSQLLNAMDDVFPWE